MSLFKARDVHFTRLIGCEAVGMFTPRLAAGRLESGTPLLKIISDRVTRFTASSLWVRVLVPGKHSFT